MAESIELPSRLGILPFRNKVLLPGAIIRIRCTSPSSVKLVEQELWQREEKGLIGILPVRDAAETTAVGPTLSQGDLLSWFPIVAGLQPFSFAKAYQGHCQHHPESEQSHREQKWRIDRCKCHQHPSVQR